MFYKLEFFLITKIKSSLLAFIALSAANHLHRHIFTVLLWSLTPLTMPVTVKFIGWSGRHI